MSKISINFVFVSLFLFVTLSFPLTKSDSPSPVVEISQGKVAGFESLSRDGRKFNSFLGIPYGKAERWEDSKLAHDWDGTRDASKEGSACAQFDIFFEQKIHGEEDCLFLNVHTPTVSSSKKLPVMVFIHGGGFSMGSGNGVGAKYFMDEDVVLVTINYRLGPLGFANTGTGANFGLKDQVLALKWVQQNIGAFAGDSNKVTIFGESAGAMSVSFLLLSPLSKGLFHRAISQSGVANSAFNFNPDPDREFRKLGVLMNCPIRKRDELLECLKRIDAISIVKEIQAAATLPEFKPDDIPNFLPSVDSNLKEKSFLPDTPLKLMESGAFHSIPWISGVNSHEGILFPSSAKDASHKKWDKTDSAQMKYDEYDCQGLIDIREFYVGNSEDPITVANNVSNLFSDRIFIHPAKISAILHARKAPMYLYYFTKKGKSTIVEALNPAGPDGLRKPAHVDEMQYLFYLVASGRTLFPEIKFDSEFAPFSDYLVKIWTSFAEHGKTPEKLRWASLENNKGINDDIEWFQLDDAHESKMLHESEILGLRLNFWNDLLSRRTKEEGRLIQ